MLFTALFVCSILLFWREVYEAGHGVVSSLFTDETPAVSMRDSDIQNIREIHFAGEGEVASGLKISDLKVISRNADTVGLSFVLESAIDSAKYPNLKVVIFSAKGGNARVVEFSPHEYLHGAKLQSETITLQVNIQSGDSSFKVSAYYDGN